MAVMFRVALCLLLTMIPAIEETAGAERQMERLGRGVVALRQAGCVFVSWRLLATDPDQVAFHIYRSTSDQTAVKLSQQPITAVTHFADTTADATEFHTYQIRCVIDGIEEPTGSSFTLPANTPARPYLAIPLQTPDGYSPNDASVGDLDGDGEYEIVLHQVGRGRDNSQSGGRAAKDDCSRVVVFPSLNVAIDALATVT